MEFQGGVAYKKACIYSFMWFRSRYSTQHALLNLINKWHSLKLLQDYFYNRTQRVKLDSTFSSWLKILLGFPQGSILGPLFFNIFLNDMLWFVEKTDILGNFTDDSTIYSCAKSVNDVIENLQSDLKIALNWFKDNQ